MISRREFLKGFTITAAGLLIPETIGRVFYSIPKVAVLQNLGKESELKLLSEMMEVVANRVQWHSIEWFKERYTTRGRLP